MIKNHQSHPTSFEPFFEGNAISSQAHGLGQRWGHGHSHGRNFPYHGAHGSHSLNFQKKKALLHHRLTNK